MRETKFRAWCRKKECWHYFTLTDLIIGRAQEEGALAYENWCEYTGLKDKNGREIYEKDIVRHVDGWIGIVDYNPPGYWIYEVAGKESAEESIWSGNIQCEIIGNIYENPELLNEPIP